MVYRSIRSEASLLRGNYQQCIDNWLHYTGQKQLLRLSFDDIINCPRELLKSCAKHISVSPSQFAEDDILKKKIFAGKTYPIRPNLREELTAIMVTQGIKNKLHVLTWSLETLIVLFS